VSQGGEKTEKATPKKRRDAREKGQVRQSTEVNTTFCCLIMFGTLYILWPWFTERLMGVFSEYLGTASFNQAIGGMNANELMGMVHRIMTTMLVALLPFLGAAMIAGITINIIQVGIKFTTKPLGLKLNRISPISGFKRMFSIKTIVDLVKSLLKIVMLGYIAYANYMQLLNEFPTYVGRNIYTTFIQIMRRAFLMALQMCIVMVFIAAADYLYQWWKYEKDLRMTKQEVKDEYKLMEGDPQIKGKIRAKQRQMSAMRMMSKVPEADVVITNPTHYAVALKYDDKVSSAPVVIAKGRTTLSRLNMTIR